MVTAMDAPEKYIKVTKTMLDAGLRGNKLLVYAYIYNYSLNSDDYYYGGQKQIAEFTGIAQPNVSRAIAELESCGLIEQRAIEFKGVRKSVYVAAPIDPLDYVENPVEKLCKTLWKRCGNGVESTT